MARLSRFGVVMVGRSGEETGTCNDVKSVCLLVCGLV